MRRALVVVGERDGLEHLTNRGPGWHADLFVYSAGEKALLSLVGAGFGLGGVAGWDARETDGECVGGWWLCRG
jgi:hypothetical protein